MNTIQQPNGKYLIQDHDIRYIGHPNDILFEKQAQSKGQQTAFLMGDPGKEHGSNFSVFDNYIHEPCYLMGMIAGSMTKTNKIGNLK